MYENKLGEIGDFAGHVMKEFVQIRVEKGSVFEKLFLLS